MPEAVVTASRILHGLDGTSVLSSKGGADSATSGVHRNERPSRQDVLYTLTSLIREPRREWRRPISCCAGRQGQIRPRPARTACEYSRGLLVDPRSRCSTVSTTQDSIERRQTLATASYSRGREVSQTRCDTCSKPIFPPSSLRHRRRTITACYTPTRCNAKPFDALRRMCGVEDGFVRSMVKCKPWKAQGGKSLSNFWKTSDDRFIIKTLADVWNIDDLYVVLFFFFPDGRLTLNLINVAREEKPNSHRPRTLLFLAYGFNSESRADSRETTRLLYCRSSQLGHRDRASKGRSSLDGEFILQPKSYENSISKVFRAVM
jgi:hypothetical protein